MTHRKPRAGLLPLYLKLYDETLPEMREPLANFAERIRQELESRGLDVTAAPICRIADEFASAVADIESADADMLVTLHLAYSPSLESADALVATSLPILMLDTTRDYDFGQGVEPERMLYNHGIHGVQDLACVLRRRGRDYQIVAGHFEHSDVLDRAADAVRGACAARRFADSRVLRIGEAFAGMGDFAVDDGTLAKRLGISVTQGDLDDLAGAAGEVTDEAIDEEMSCDRERFAGEVSDEAHRRSVRVGLALRRLIERDGYSAISANFQVFDRADGPVDTVPFLEISKAMERGIGYAGEGDVLTAALVGALSSAFGRTTFTEIFCPDWMGDALFLSHMGEISPSVAGDEKPLLREKDFPFTPTNNPVAVVCAPAPGPAVFVNLAPGPDDTFRLIAAPVEVLADGTHPEMREAVRGWIRPRCGCAEFLERFSRLGGTHHSALVLGDRIEGIRSFARLAGLECCIIE